MTAPDPRPGGCLHGPGARLGVCPNCGTIVDDAELARVAGTAGTTCECTHSIDRHLRIGCVERLAGKPSPCPCTRKPSDVLAARVAAARAEGRAEAETARLAEVEAKVRALADEWEGRAADMLAASGDKVLIAGGGGPIFTALTGVYGGCADRLRAILSDAPEADAPVPGHVPHTIGSTGQTVCHACRTPWPCADAPVPQRDAGVREAVLAVLDEYARTCHPAPYTSERALYERLCAAVESAPATREAEDRGESS